MIAAVVLIAMMAGCDRAARGPSGEGNGAASGAAARTGVATDTAAVAPPPVVPRTPEVTDGVYGWAPRESAPLGVGRLFPARGATDRPGADWVTDITLRLHDRPGGRAWGWLVRGWLVEDTARTPLTTDGMVETDYEIMSIIVTEARADGWLQVRFAAPTARDHGLAWIAPAGLADGVLPVTFEPWERRFMSGEISPLYFRDAAGGRIFAAPDSVQSVRAIEGNHRIDALEVRGDWMRVRVMQPSDYCAVEPVDGTMTEGWIRWRDPVAGPLVWYYTRGC